jgi:L-iditol 2-dehydrogenase
MKAVVKHGQGPDMVELRDVPIPEVRPGAVLLEVKAAGVCGWDIEMWRHRMANPVTVPVIQGHEFCGVVAEVGPGVESWKPGDRVTSETSAAVCGRCRPCRSGDYQVCPERKGFGYGVDGAFTKYVVVRQEILHRLPEMVSFEEGALTEPFCVAHRAVADGGGVRAGDVVTVIGPGPVGLVCLQMARVLGAARTVLVGVEAGRNRLELARRQGWADEIVLADRGDAVKAVLDCTGGDGADVVIDAAGNSAALVAAMGCVRRLGRIVKVGWGSKPFGHSLDELLRKSATLQGTFGHNWRNWRVVLALLAAGRLDARSLVSGVLPISRWREAYERAESEQAVKMLLTPED